MASLNGSSLLDAKGEQIDYSAFIKAFEVVDTHPQEATIQLTSPRGTSRNASRYLSSGEEPPKEGPTREKPPRLETIASQGAGLGDRASSQLDTIASQGAGLGGRTSSSPV